MRLRITALFGAIWLGAFGVGCTKGSSSTSSSSTALKVSGKINVSAGSQKASLVDSDKVSALSVDLTIYTVTCSTLTPPVQTGTGVVAADGTFSVNIAGAANQPMSCHLVDGAGDNQGDFLVTDAAHPDMHGNDSVSNTMALDKDADLGTVAFDPNAKELTIPKTAVASALVATVPAAAAVFDPTGEWTIGAVDFTLPNGVVGPCTGGGGGGGGNCNGPPDGQAIYMKLWKGSVIADNSDIYGLQLWDSHAAYTTCGGKIGLPNSVKTSLGVDFSSNGGADAIFNLATSLNGFHDNYLNALTNVNITNGYQMDDAQSTWDTMTKCGPKDITIASVVYSNAWVCGQDHAGNYQAQLGGGCTRDSDSKNVQVNDWSGINSCGMSSQSGGIQSQSCTGTATVDGVAGVNVTCSNKWAVLDNAYAVLPNGTFGWNDAEMTSGYIAKGTACSAFPNTSDAEKIAQLHCYSDYFWSSGLSDSSAACLPRVNIDWSASDPNNFAQVDFRPNKLAFFEQYKPYLDGKGGALLSRQERFDGVQVDQSWVNCRVIETGGLSFKQISSNKLLAIYQQSTITTSVSKPACAAAFTGERKTFMFYLTK